MKRIIVVPHSLSIVSITLLHVHNTSYSLYQVLILTAKTYIKSLLKYKSSHDGHLQSIKDPHHNS